MPKVSVIIPCYNHGQYIDQAVESVLAQTFQDFEVIIINDGSTDSYTNELLLNYKKPKTRVIKTENCGPSSARNMGINNANGEYILPLDADDYISNTYLEKAVKILDNELEIKIVYCMAEKFGNENQRWNLNKFSIEGMYLYNCIFSSALFRKDDWLRIDGYASDMTCGYEDWDFWLSILGTDGEVFRIPEVLFFYRIHDYSRNILIDWKKETMLRYKIYRKHEKAYKKLKLRFRFLISSLNIISKKIRHKI